MKNVVIILVMFLISGGVFAGDFRKADWGMSIEEVIALEGDDWIRDSEKPDWATENEEFYVYERDVFGYTGNVVYHFRDGLLIAARYYFYAELQVFIEFEDRLIRQYGYPEYLPGDVREWHISSRTVLNLLLNHAKEIFIKYYSYDYWNELRQEELKYEAEQL